jgi:hypothetical protein
MLKMLLKYLLYATPALYSPSASPTAGGHNVTAQPSAGTISPAAEVAVTDLTGVFTHRNDNARTGHRGIRVTPATVSTATFGKLFSLRTGQPGVCVRGTVVRRRPYDE